MVPFTQPASRQTGRTPVLPLSSTIGMGLDSPYVPACLLAAAGVRVRRRAGVACTLRQARTYDSDSAQDTGRVAGSSSARQVYRYSTAPTSSSTVVARRTCLPSALSLYLSVCVREPYADQFGGFPASSTRRRTARTCCDATVSGDVRGREAEMGTLPPISMHYIAYSIIQR